MASDPRAWGIRTAGAAPRVLLKRCPLSKEFKLILFTTLRAALCAGLLVSGAAAQAATIFADDLESTATGSNRTPAGWTVTDGTVDTVGPGYFATLCRGTGTCIDLDGSTGNAGVLSMSFSLLDGVEYTAWYDLAGSNRGGSDTVDVSFGTSAATHTLAGAAGYNTWSLGFTPAASGNYLLSFANRGGDNVGAILDNVAVSAVPEPSTTALAMVGLLGLAGMARRRRR